MGFNQFQIYGNILNH